VSTDHALDADDAVDSGGTTPVRRRWTDPVGSPSLAYTLLLVFGSALGLLGAFSLTVDRIRLLKDPGTQLSCSLNSVVNCASVMTSPQGEAFGFANPIIGLVAFGGLLVFGMGLLARARYAVWMWGGLLLGTIFGIGFVGWLMFQSIYHIQRLCPWCMLVWSVTIPIFVTTALYVLADVLPVPAPVRHVAAFLRRWQALCLIVVYAIPAVLIVSHFGLSIFG
jgi:uncharacterized membrane protein